MHECISQRVLWNRLRVLLMSRLLPSKFLMYSSKVLKKYTISWTNNECLIFQFLSVYPMSKINFGIQRIVQICRVNKATDRELDLDIQQLNGAVFPEISSLDTECKDGFLELHLN